jgi:hypothetical protein
MILVDYLLGGDPFLPGFDGNGNTVLIRTAYKNNVFFLQPQVPGINICRDVNTCQVSDVNRSVGIWQGRCNEMAFGILHFCKQSLVMGVKKH